MNLTAYDFALIGGGFTIVGALIGAITAYWFSLHLSSHQQRSIAAANFRAAFSSVISQMAIAQTDKKIDAERLLMSTFSDLSVAIETYRPFVRCEDRKAYQEAWDSYYKVGGSVRFFDYYITSSNDKYPPYELFTKRIENILKFAPL